MMVGDGARGRRPPKLHDPAPTTADPIEIAMEAEAADASADSPARTLLVNQNRLVLWQIASERAGFGLKVLTALAGLALAAGLGVMVWQATQADGVIVEPFRISAPLVAEGVSGEVMASQVLDGLSSLRAETVETGRGREYENAWGQEISVAIPTTGINLGDLQTALRRWLGHETVISGEAFRLPSGDIALRARVRGGRVIRAQGPAGDLESVAGALARGIYAETQPVRFARWLVDHGDVPAGLALAQKTALSAKDRRARAEAYAEWANATDRAGSSRDALALSRKARRLAPDWWLPAFQLSGHEFNLGHSEAALIYMRDAVRLKARDPSLPKDERGTSFYRMRAAAMVSDFVEREPQLLAAQEDPATIAEQGATLDRAVASGMANGGHDILGARARLARPQFVRPWRGEIELVALSAARMSILEAAEDWEVLAKEPLSSSPTAQWGKGGGNGLIGLAKVASGDVAGGMMILDAAPTDCDGCMLYRARALALTGANAEADRLAAAVEARTPSIPTASLVRGRIRLDAGNPAAALASLREAQKRQPNWADPYRYDGDALAQLRRWTEAVAAYEKAFKLAPKWGGLHLKWGEALAAQGKTAEARAHWQTANGLYLTAPERALLSEDLV